MVSARSRWRRGFRAGRSSQPILRDCGVWRADTPPVVLHNPYQASRFPTSAIVSLMAQQSFEEERFPQERYAANQTIRAQIEHYLVTNPIDGRERSLQLDEVIEMILGR